MPTSGDGDDTDPAVSSADRHDVETSGGGRLTTECRREGVEVRRRVEGAPPRRPPLPPTAAATPGPVEQRRPLVRRGPAARAPSATDIRFRAPTVASCSPWGRRCAITTAGARAAATSATAFWPACVTTTSEVHSSCQRSGEGCSGLRSVQTHSGVASRAARTAESSTSRPPPPQSTRTRGASCGAATRVGRGRPSNREIAPTAHTLSVQVVGHACVWAPAGHGARSASARSWADRCGRSVRSPGIAVTTTGTPHRRSRRATSTETSTTTSEGCSRAAHDASTAIRAASPAWWRGAQCSTPPASTPAAPGSVTVGASSRASRSQRPVQPSGTGRLLSPTTSSRRCGATASIRARCPCPWWWTYHPITPRPAGCSSSRTRAGTRRPSARPSRSGPRARGRPPVTGGPPRAPPRRLPRRRRGRPPDPRPG